MIYLKLSGRIGNQIFMYAFAKQIQLEKGNNEEIIIDDSQCTALKYRNSLKEYDLRNVKYVDGMPEEYRKKFRLQSFFASIDSKVISKMDYNKSFKFEKKLQKFYNILGLIKIRDGYMKYSHKHRKNTYIDGYFQSEKFFEGVKTEIIKTFSLEKNLKDICYPKLEEIKKRNTVCISIKVEHNVDNPMYDVCNEEYYRKAIKYVCERVDKPLFFVCSDNVKYVKKHLIDTSKYEYIEQSTEFPVEVSLAVMAQCKNFIIGNSSYAWWAQYLSNRENKIVVAPSRWYGIPADWQWDIYCDNWVKIEV